MRVRRLIRLPVLSLIRAYQWGVSPLIPARCRYAPTCSAYAAEAVMRHGVWRGGWLVLARLCRCHPWGGHGFDPVPAALSRQPFYAPWRYGRWRYDDKPERDETERDETERHEAL